MKLKRNKNWKTSYDIEIRWKVEEVKCNLPQKKTSYISVYWYGSNETHALLHLGKEVTKSPQKCNRKNRWKIKMQCNEWSDRIC